MSDILEIVAERRREWVDAVNEGDLERYANIVCEDLVWLPPRGPAIKGRQAFREWLTPFFAGYDYHFSVEPTQVRVFEQFCGELGRFRSVLSPKGEEKTQEHSGTYFVLWRLEGDGVWRIERYVDGVGEISPK